MKYELLPAVLVALGWAIHWGMSWKEEFKISKVTLRGYIDKNPPAFYTSVLTVIAAYLVGPDLLLAAGIEIPQNGIKLIGAFILGYFADSAIYKLMNLSKKVEQ